MIRAPRLYSKRVRSLITEDMGLDPDRYAAQKVEQELLSDETLIRLYQAMDLADRQETRDLRESYSELADYYGEVRRSIDSGFNEAVKARVDQICHTVIGGHSVDLRHSSMLDCPNCLEEGEETECYHLGHADRGSGGLVTGWVCGHCEAVIEEPETGDLRLVGGDQ